jgi:hypothetical protein
MIKQTKTVRKNGSSSQSTPLQPSLLHQDHIDEDDQLRVENNRPFEMLLDPQINANALTWAQNGNKARIETKGFEPCAWGYLDVHFDTRIWVGARRG